MFASIGSRAQRSRLPRHTATGASWDPVTKTLAFGQPAGIQIYNNGWGTADSEYGVFDWTTTPNVLTIGAKKSGSGAGRSVAFISSVPNGTAFTWNDGAGTTKIMELIDGNAGLSVYPGSAYTFLNAGANNVFGMYGVSGGTANQTLRFGSNSAPTTPTTLEIYNTADILDGQHTPTDYERCVIDWKATANLLRIGSEKGGTGTLRDVQFFRGDPTTTGDAIVLQSATSGSINFINQGSSRLYMFGDSLRMRSLIVFGWASGGADSTNIDTAFARNAAGIVEINNGSAGTFRDLSLRNLFVASGGKLDFNAADVTITHSTDLLTVAGGGIVLAAGTTGIVPLRMTNGTNATTALSGGYEYDGETLFFTSNNTGTAARGGLFPHYTIRLDATFTLTSNTNAQKIFNTPTNGTVTLPVGSYTFDAFICVDTMSATSGNAAFSLAGTAVLGSILQGVIGIDGAKATAGAAASASWSGTAAVPAAATSAVLAGTATEMMVFWRGSFKITTAGTIIPSIQLITANAAVVRAGSWFTIRRLGAQTATSFGPWT